MVAVGGGGGGGAVGMMGWLEVKIGVVESDKNQNMNNFYVENFNIIYYYSLKEVNQARMRRGPGS